MRITNDRVPNRSQSFGYDNLNRITSAATQATHATDPTDCWGEAYVYDVPASTGAWGNLIQINPASSAYTGCTQESFNQTVTAYNQISGWCYDAAGNLQMESASPCLSPTYSYDAENRLVSTAGVTYQYDGDGKRVAKSNGKLYWYGGGGNPVAETDASGNTTDEYIFFGGQRIARRDSAGNIVYYMADHLGTSRIVTSSTGAILDESDFYPFGGERIITFSSGNTYKFTGKERDSESNLDNFGARYNSSSIGRFMSVDPSRLSVKLYDPQTWNRYTYARDNPLRYVDRNGKWSTEVHIQIIDDVFKNILSGVDRNILVQANGYVDDDQSVGGSYKHGMRALGQTPEEARGLGEAFVASHLDAAVQDQLDWERSGNTGFSPGALFQFGESLHTVTDETSPWHDNYNEPWGHYWDPLGSLSHVGFETMLGKSHLTDSARAEAEYQARVLWSEFLKKLDDQRKAQAEEQRKQRCAEGDKKSCS